uniref:Retrotransposon gag domain-containing protein n=1 Tax=Fagus sylvatica TaxID=28930 RepID=A0A2N9F895_FAGSY
MPPKSKKARTVNSKILLQEGATTSNSSPQEVHQEVEQGAVDPNINMLYEMIQKTQAKLAEIAKHVKKTKTTDEGSALEHVSKFLDAMGPHVGDSNLCPREFSKSLTDRAYTWYATLQPASVKTWDDMVEMFCGKFFHVEERVTLHTLHSVKQKARKTTASVKLVERSRVDKRSTPHALVVTSINDTRNKKKCGKEKEFKEWPAIPCTTEEMHAIIDKWIMDGFLRLLGVSKEPTEDDKKHARNPLPNHNKERGAISVVIHAGTEDANEELEDSLSTNLATIKTLQRSPKFQSLFNQLGLGPDARKAATEAIVNIAAGSGSQCYTAEAHASRAFLETTNAVTFTDENMEVQYPDHQKPLYVAAMINVVHIRRALVETGASLNLIPTSTLDAVGISRKKIQGISMEVTEFGGAAEYTVGHI